MDCEPTMADEPVQPGNRSGRSRALREVRTCASALEHQPKHTPSFVDSLGLSLPGERRGCIHRGPRPPGLAECVPRRGPGQQVRDQPRRRGSLQAARWGRRRSRWSWRREGLSPPALSNELTAVSVTGNRPLSQRVRLAARTRLHGPLAQAGCLTAVLSSTAVAVAGGRPGTAAQVFRLLPASACRRFRSPTLGGGGQAAVLAR
jgi:hypothetical protein